MYKKVDTKDKIDPIFTESKIQSDCFVWFWNTFPNLRRCLFHIPNGGFRNRVEANKLKSIGVVAGIPDLCFVFNGTCVFFEIKRETGKLSPDQQKVIFKLKEQGITTHVIKDFETFKKIIHETIEGH